MSNVDQRRYERQGERFLNFRLHMKTNSDFYEPLEYYKPSDDFRDLILEKLPPGWRLNRSSIYYNVLPPNPVLLAQGWKIHVSSALNEGKEILNRVLSFIIDTETPMKCVVDPLMLRIVNSREWPRGGSGKFITIYPRSAENCSELLEALYEELTGFHGPYILSDQRYKDCSVLYYRYGGINPRTKLRYNGRKDMLLVAPDGTEWIDQRNPFFTLPPWIEHDPFVEPSSDESEGEAITLKNGRYIVLHALHFSNAGGVYLALDSQTGAEVIIKEARPYTDCDPFGNDAQVFRKNELRVLEQIQDTEFVPKLVDFFEEWEHVYLVREYVAGKTLSSQTILWPPCGLHDSSAYSALHESIIRNHEIGVSVIKAVNEIHKRGVIIGDLSANNVLLDDNGNPIIVDLDGSYINGDSTIIPFFTVGFSRKDRIKSTHPTIDDDNYSLACLLISLIHPITFLLDMCPNVCERFLEEIEKDYNLVPNTLKGIAELLKTSGKNDVNEYPIILSQSEQEIHNGPKFRGISNEEVDEILQRITTGLIQSATPDRSDRLYPSDPEITNPLGVANGALGVAYALQTLQGSIPPEHLDWINMRELHMNSYAPGLYHGLSGIAWVMSEIGLQDKAMQAMEMADNHPLLFGGADVEHGVTGYGLTNLYFWNQTKDSTFLQKAINIGLYLINTAKWESTGPYWMNPNGLRFLGYAQGSSGISLFFLYLYLSTQDERFLTIGKQALQAELTVGVDQVGGYMSFPEEPGAQIVTPYWRYGSAGVATSLIRYVKFTGDNELRSILSKIIPDTQRKYTVFAGLFNGLSGLGNCLLDCHSLLGHDTLDVARGVARGISLYQINREDCAFFPGDFLFRCSADFATGAAGIGLFLNRLRNNTPNFNFVLDSFYLDKN